jgi:antitoxin ParD1/3/4
MTGRTTYNSTMAKFAISRYDEVMATMNVSLPDTLKDFVERQVGERGYGTSSEFVRDLIRHEQARTELRALIVDGMTSGPGSTLDDDYFTTLRKRIRDAGDV